MFTGMFLRRLFVCYCEHSKYFFKGTFFHSYDSLCNDLTPLLLSFLISLGKSMKMSMWIQSELIYHYTNFRELTVPYNLNVLHLLHPRKNGSIRTTCKRDIRRKIKRKNARHKQTSTSRAEQRRKKDKYEKCKFNAHHQINDNAKSWFYRCTSNKTKIEFSILKWRLLSLYLCLCVRVRVWAMTFESHFIIASLIFPFVLCLSLYIFLSLCTLYTVHVFSSFAFRIPHFCFLCLSFTLRLCLNISVTISLFSLDTFCGPHSIRTKW